MAQRQSDIMWHRNHIMWHIGRVSSTVPPKSFTPSLFKAGTYDTQNNFKALLFQFFDCFYHFSPFFSPHFLLRTMLPLLLTPIFCGIESFSRFFTCVLCGNYRLLNRACPLKTHSPLTVQPFVKLTPFPPQLCSRQSQNSSPNHSQTAACVKLLCLSLPLCLHSSQLFFSFWSFVSITLLTQHTAADVPSHKSYAQSLEKGGGLTKQNGKGHF